MLFISREAEEQYNSLMERVPINKKIKDMLTLAKLYANSIEKTMVALNLSVGKAAELIMLRNSDFNFYFISEEEYQLMKISMYKTVSQILYMFWSYREELKEWYENYFNEKITLKFEEKEKEKEEKKKKRREGKEIKL